MLWLLLLILWPIAELFVAVKVADAIGVLPMLVLLVAGFPVGIWAIRSQGRAAMRRLSNAIGSGDAPGREVLNGALALLGGSLLIVPGFITDVLGLVLLLPPTRAGARGLIARNLRSRFVVRAVSFGARDRHYDFESTAVDVDQPSIDSRPPQLPA
jgi:UPF0716 protein FxsA